MGIEGDIRVGGQDASHGARVFGRQTLSLVHASQLSPLPFGIIGESWRSTWTSRSTISCCARTDTSSPAAMENVPAGGPAPRPATANALVDAPFGDEAAWNYPPASGEIAAGWLHGRGSADPKAGAAIFAHVAARLRDTAGGFGGSVVLLFDVDQHTGGFGGAKAYFEHAGPVDGVMIGYPGLDHVVTGGRGVLRARVHVHGVAGHSGSTRTGAGAITKAADLIRKLDEVQLPGPPGPDFPLPAKLTVTAISGGEGYSMVPDLCAVNVDIRLSPALDDPAAVALLRQAVTDTDAVLLAASLVAIVYSLLEGRHLDWPAWV